MRRFGLDEKDIQAICGVLARCPHVDKAILYGSRACGSFKNGSDIDLTLLGADLTATLLYRIMDQLDDLLLPYMMDLSLYTQIEDPNLIAHIQQAGIPLYQRSDRGLL